MDNKEKNNEEIDLGQLFQLIGNAFKRLFEFIVNIFKSVFHFIILILLFFQKHFIKFVVALFIGIAIGWFLDYSSDKIYNSSMVVEPNFNSVQQLYNNVEFYNELAEEEEFGSLAEALKIDSIQASSIEKVTIESFSDETQKIKQFSEFIKDLDTISQRYVDYNDYLENFNNISAPFHKITIEATNSTVAKRCQEAIVNSIESNQYFQLQKVINEINLNIQDSIIDRQIAEIDSLQRFYRRLKLIEAQKPESNTSISLSEQGNKQTLEIELLQKASELKDQLVSLNKEKANTRSTINIISAFPAKGVLVNDFFRKKKVVVPLICVGLLLIGLLIVEINRFLKNYNR